MDSEPADGGASGTVTLSAEVTHPRVIWINLLHLDIPWRYQNFGLLAATSPSSIWDALVGQCICLHVIACLIPFSGEEQCEYTLLVPPHVCQALLSFGIEGNSFNVISMVDLWMVGQWTKDYLAQAQLAHCEINSNTVSP